MKSNLLRRTVTELKALMKQTGQSYHYLAANWGLKVPPTGKGVPKKTKEALLERVVRIEVERIKAKETRTYVAWYYYLAAQMVISDWIKNFKPSLLEVMALYAVDEES